MSARRSANFGALHLGEAEVFEYIGKAMDAPLDLITIQDELHPGPHYEGV